jgi:hypothetical protein
MPRITKPLHRVVLTYVWLGFDFKKYLKYSDQKVFHPIGLVISFFLHITSITIRNCNFSTSDVAGVSRHCSTRTVSQTTSALCRQESASPRIVNELLYTYLALQHSELAEFAVIDHLLALDLRKEIELIPWVDLELVIELKSSRTYFYISWLYILILSIFMARSFISLAQIYVVHTLHPKLMLTICTQNFS